MEKLAINESNPVDVETVKKLLKLKEEELKAMRVDFEAEAKAASEKLVSRKKILYFPSLVVSFIILPFASSISQFLLVNVLSSFLSLGCEQSRLYHCVC